MNTSFLRNKQLLWYWLPPLAWCGLIFSLSGDLGAGQNTRLILTWLLSWFPPLSPAQFDLVHFYFRKTLGHFCNYAFLYFLWFRAFRVQVGLGARRARLCSLGFCLGQALLDEGRQALFASRSSSIWDVVLDMGGALTSALITSVFWSARAAGKHELPDPTLET